MNRARYFRRMTIQLVCLWVGVFAVLNVSRALAQAPQVKLTPSDAAQLGYFGYSVSVSGDTAIVGAYQDDTPTTDSGSAYIFTRSGDVWTQQAKLIADDGEARDNFGYSVSISGDTAVVGAYIADIGTFTNAGAVYVFTRSDGVWTQQAKLTASDNRLYGPAGFGFSVSISGDTVIVGSRLRNVGSLTAAGSAYVFMRSGGVWTQQAILTAADAVAFEYFGYSVSVSGDTAVVGALLDRDSGSNTGSVYVFTRSDSTWTQQAEIHASDAATNDNFGVSVSISGDTVAVGAYKGVVASSPASAYIFTGSGSTWTQQAKLTASDGAAGDLFGVSVSVSGDTAVVGAAWDDDGRGNSGSAYVFARSSGVWTQKARLAASDAAAGDKFGYSVATDAGRVISGAYFKSDPGTNSGAAYAIDVTSLVPPIVSSFSINGGAASTTSRTVTLNNACSTSPTQYMASESSSFIGANWQPWSPAPTFTLSPGVGTKTVYFKAMNANGESPVMSDAISLNEPPSVSSFSINNGAASTTSRTVTLNNTCTNSPTQYMAGESPSFAGASWRPYSTAPNFALSPGGGTKTVYFKTTNADGESVAVSDTILLNVPPPVAWTLF